MGYIRANLMACVLGLAAAIFLIISVAQSVQINGFLWIDGLKDELEECAKDRNELRAISSKKNEQVERTKETIRESEKQLQIADKIADRIEAAPTAPNCATPETIMGADL
jgi:low affinity Fe/Cu permease